MTVYVGGITAIFADFATVLTSKLPLFIGVVVLMSFLLLAVVLRSLLVPLKAAIMNLLSIAAAFGILTAVFQWGWLGDLFGVSRPGPVEAFLPVMLFAILFGLSMDYEVFLVMRIHEEWLRSGDNHEAVRAGSRRRRHHHRGRRDHDRGVRLVHLGRRAHHQGVRPGPGRGDLRRRGHHPHGIGARADAPDGQGELVVPGLARPRAATIHVEPEDLSELDEEPLASVAPTG